MLKNIIGYSPNHIADINNRKDNNLDNDIKKDNLHYLGNAPGDTPQGMLSNCLAKADDYEQVFIAVQKKNGNFEYWATDSHPSNVATVALLWQQVFNHLTNNGEEF